MCDGGGDGDGRGRKSKEGVTAIAEWKEMMVGGRKWRKSSPHSSLLSRSGKDSQPRPADHALPAASCHWPPPTPLRQASPAALAARRLHQGASSFDSNAIEARSHRVSHPPGGTRDRESRRRFGHRAASRVAPFRTKWCAVLSRRRQACASASARRGGAFPRARRRAYR